MCSSGRSFKSSNIQSLIAFEKNFFSINGYDSNRGFTLSLSKEISKPISIKINNTKTTTSSLIKEFPSTAIHNNTFSFANASPDFRRKIIDRSLFVSDESFSKTWFGFYRCLKQRNSLLKNRDIKYIDAWNKKVSQEAKSLDKKRVNFFNKSFLEFKNILSILDTCTTTEYLDKIRIEFFSGWDSRKELYDVLVESEQKDLIRKTTTEGPHKADVKIFIGENDAKQILSRGEQKILSILWCCAQHEVLRKIYNIKATLIVDDIKSELDDNTFNVFINLLDFLNNQIIFSCIDDHFSSKIKDKYKEFKKFHVEQLR